MGRHRTARSETTRTSIARSQSDPRWRWPIPVMIAKYAGLAVAMIALIGVIAPAPAYAGSTGVEIINQATGSARIGLRIDVMQGSTNLYQGAFLWPNNPNASQEFDLPAVENGFFQIRARHSGLCLMPDRRSGTFTDGTPIVQLSCDNKSLRSAQWSVERRQPNCEAGALCVDTGARIIVNRYTRKCLDTANPSNRAPRQQAILQQWACIELSSDRNAKNQIWNIRDAKTGRIVR